MEHQLSQLQGESNKNYELLCKFVTSGFDRNVSKFAESVGLSRQQIHNIAKQNNWKNRISEFESQSLEELQLETILKFQSLQKKELEENLETYKTLQKALEIANNSLIDLNIDEVDCEQAMNITGKYLNVLLKCNKMSKIIEEKLNRFGFDESQSQGHHQKVKPHQKRKIEQREKVKNEQRQLTAEEQEKLKILENELSEVNMQIENKSKLKAMGHRETQKLYRKRNELRQRINDFV